MTDKERAEQLRELADGGIMAAETRRAIWTIADELDPPRVVPSTVVWWQDDEGLSDPVLGQVNDIGVIMLFGTKDTVRMESVKWWPAHFLAPGQVPVTIPPVSEWPEESKWMTMGYVFENRGMYITPTATRITRVEAERMEEER